MQLNPDCIRDILIGIENNTSYKVSTSYPSKSLDYLRDTYPDMMIRYHILQCSKFNLIELKKIDDFENMYISDLTPQGHQFLANIRSENIWHKTKLVCEKVGSTSLECIMQITSSVLSELIKSSIGLH